MCGIIAYSGNRKALPILTAGLRRLEYRGYDSAGITLHQRGKLTTWRASGKLVQLQGRLPAHSMATCGMGHTRWATHGEPIDRNAHPHLSFDGKIAIIHNGIIENAARLRNAMEEDGVQFSSETDSEILAHLIALQPADSLTDSVRQALQQVQGTYGLVVMDARLPGELVVVRKGSPVIIGEGEREMFVTSDANAILNHTREVVHLEDGELASVNARAFAITTMEKLTVSRPPVTLLHDPETLSRGGYDHYMLKEIEEQPESISQTLGGRLDRQFSTAHLGGLNLTAGELRDIRRVRILGCGSAHYAGLAGGHMIEALARLPATSEPAAEFRYRNPIIENDTLYLAVSQSGETYDTLAAIREIQNKGGRVLGICNVVGSSISREVDGGVYMHVGPEISVASTKAFSGMLVCFMLLALKLGRIRDLSPQHGNELVNAITNLPALIKQALAESTRIHDVARKYHHMNHAFFIGRTVAYPVALEGAQKLKEISYVHAEAYPASELKHGPLALISPEIPTVAILPDNDLLDKTLSSLQEIRARKGPVIAVTNCDRDEIGKLANEVIWSPPCHPLLHPLILNIGLQLYAYHTAVLLGRDVDQPRNLAKSVTVE